MHVTLLEWKNIVNSVLNITLPPQNLCKVGYEILICHMSFHFHYIMDLQYSIFNHKHWEYVTKFEKNSDTKILHMKIVNTLHTCIEPEILSRSLRISCKFLVPSMFLNVVWAKSLVEWWAFSTLATDTVAFDTR